MVVRKGIILDEDKDRDILEWFDSLPPRSHSTYIRLAIRSYMKQNGSTKLNSSNSTYEDLNNKIENLQTQINNIYENNKIKKNDEKYVDGSSIFDNLGK